MNQESARRSTPPAALCYPARGVGSLRTRFRNEQEVLRSLSVAVTYRIDTADRIVYLTTVGESSFAEWRDVMLRALSDPQYRRGMGFLSDRRGQTDVPDPEFARAAAQFLMQHD